MPLCFLASKLLSCVLRNVVVLLVLSSQTGAAEQRGDLPRQVQHAFGTTVIETDPTRIVTIGWSGEDAVLSLGRVPVAMTAYEQFDNGIFPWNEPRLGSAHPSLLVGEIDYEKIASLKPDLILAIYSGVDKRQWLRLSAIAPTVVFRSGPWAADWKEVISITGETLGKTADAELLVEQTENFVQNLGRNHRGLKGKTFTFGTYLPGSNSVVVYLPSDPRIQILMQLGLKVSPEIERLGIENPGKTSVGISLERIRQIDADLLIMWYRDHARSEAEAQPLFKSLRSVRTGAYVALDDPISVWSTSALSVLSIPYGFPSFVPKLAAAVARGEKTP